MSRMIPPPRAVDMPEVTTATTSSLATRLAVNAVEREGEGAAQIQRRDGGGSVLTDHG